MISGLVILSEPRRMCYPYREAIQSFLPVVDEMVVVINRLHDETEVINELKALDPKVRIVSGIFNLFEWGWASYGIMRTSGYYACKGDVVLMFDADGILHEGDEQLLKDDIGVFVKNQVRMGYWGKYRFYTPTRYWDQNKHSGIYNKALIGDNMDFYRRKGDGVVKGVPNPFGIPEPLRKSKQFHGRLFGYEHLWDTKEVVHEKIVRYGRMSDVLAGKEPLSDEQYMENYINNLERNLKERGKTMPIEKHPKVIQEKLRNLTPEHFGHSFFK